MATGTGKSVTYRPGWDHGGGGGDEQWLPSEGWSYCRLSGWVREGNLGQEREGQKRTVTKYVLRGARVKGKKAERLLPVPVNISAYVMR
jgi:hypothetical protein